jgi:hypothetical protein
MRESKRDFYFEEMLDTIILFNIHLTRLT